MEGEKLDYFILYFFTIKKTTHVLVRSLNVCEHLFSIFRHPQTSIACNLNLIKKKGHYKDSRK